MMSLLEALEHLLVSSDPADRQSESVLHQKRFFLITAGLLMVVIFPALQRKVCKSWIMELLEIAISFKTPWRAFHGLKGGLCVFV